MRLLVFAIGCILSFAAVADETCKPAEDPSKIAVAGGSVTELIYYLGEQEKLVAVDRTSNYPEPARALPQIGYVRGLSTEGLLSLEPTLVLGESDMGPAEVLAQLAETGIETIRVGEAHTPTGVIEKLRCVANVLAVSEETLASAESKLAPDLKKLNAITKSEYAASAVVILVFQQGSAIAAGAGTSGNGLLEMAGLRNALADMDGWKPLSTESLIRANPDYLVETDRAVGSAGGLDEILSNPGIRLTKAGKNKQLIQMDGMAMLGFGPRTLNAAVSLAELTAKK